MKNKKNGFTLIELMLGITLSAFIFLATSSLISLLYKTDTKTERSQQIENVKNDLQQEFSTSIKWAANIDTSVNKLIIDSNTYELKNEKIYKNSDALTSVNVSILSFEAKDVSTDPSLKALQILITLSNKNFPSTTDTLKLFVSQRKQTITGSEVPPEASIKPTQIPATPKPSGTPGPTKSPGPSGTPKPSVTPKPSGTPGPTKSPSPTPGR